MLKHLATMIVIGGVVFLMWGISPMVPLTVASQTAKASGKPAFQTMIAENVRRTTHIVSSRSTAALGFNIPLLRVYLPRIDNSAYAVVTFDTPRLFKASGQPVEFELERGGYNEKLYADEIRFVSPGGIAAPTYARAKGAGRIQYPLKIVTRTVHSGKTTNNPEVIINSPLVTYIDQNIPEMVFLQSSIGPVRAYDATGRQLIIKDYNASQAKGEITRRTLAFLGEIAEVQIDTVTQWAEMAFTYDLPPTKPLPDSYSGHTVSRPPKITATPGGKVSLTLIQSKRPTSPREASPKSPQTLDTGMQSFHNALAMPTNPENEAAIKQLIKAGADVNAKNNWGRMSLHLVTYRCDTTVVVQALIEAGADVNAQTAHGNTPLWLAQQMKCQENIRLLKQAGAK